MDFAQLSGAQKAAWPAIVRFLDAMVDYERRRETAPLKLEINFKNGCPRTCALVGTENMTLLQSEL